MSGTASDGMQRQGGAAHASDGVGRLPRLFADARSRRGTLLMPYITGGYPTLDECSRLTACFIAAGADIVELGVPYSDPVADGPVVQASAHQALTAGVTTDDVFELAAAHSATTPFVLLAYANTVLAYGLERFVARCAGAGVEGVVVPDLPADEAGDLIAAGAAHGVAAIMLAAPTSSDARLDLIVEKARGFVYCVAVTGVTGVRAGGGDELPELVARLRARTELPLVAGFGIGTPEQARRAGAICDGVIIGSALIDIVARSTDVEAACAATGRLLRATRSALDAPS